MPPEAAWWSALKKTLFMLRQHRSGNASDETARKLGLSIGEALWEPGEDPPEIEALLRFADREMYREEEAKKNGSGTARSE
ncbi:MAG TPA: hypothetical protein GXX19_11855 [Syntrophomonadaceae bacterium]|nr:hypothetical protein [Syntrophomonadaceae bacterium]